MDRCKQEVKKNEDSGKDSPKEIREIPEMVSLKCDYLSSKGLKIVKDRPSGQRRIYEQSENLNREIKYF